MLIDRNPKDEELKASTQIKQMLGFTLNANIDNPNLNVKSIKEISKPIPIKSATDEE